MAHGCGHEGTAPPAHPRAASCRSIGRASPADVIAGATLAALAMPEVMGYTKIAEMPVITGLYTLVLPVAAFAILGSSRHLVVGADRQRQQSWRPA